MIALIQFTVIHQHRLAQVKLTMSSPPASSSLMKPTTVVAPVVPFIYHIMPSQMVQQSNLASHQYGG